MKKIVKLKKAQNGSTMKSDSSYARPVQLKDKRSVKQILKDAKAKETQDYVNKMYGVKVNPVTKSDTTKVKKTGGSASTSKKPIMAKGGTAGGTALKNALVKAGYKKGGMVKSKKK